MRKWILCLVLTVSAVSAMASGTISVGPITSDAGTNKVVLPPRMTGLAPVLTLAVTTNAYGDLVSNMGINYMVTSGGVATNKPTAASGSAAVDGVTYTVVPQKPRDGLAVCNITTNTLYVSFGASASIGSGYALVGAGSTLKIEGGRDVVPQGEVNFCAAGTGGQATAIDW